MKLSGDERWHIIWPPTVPPKGHRFAPGGRPPTAVVEAVKAALVSHGVFTVEGAKMREVQHVQPAKRAFVEFRGACEDDWLQADTSRTVELCFS